MGTTEQPTEPAGKEVPTSVRWRILLLLLAFSFMSWFNRASMAAAGDERIMPRYNISKETMGLVYSAFLFVYAIAMTPGGWFIDRAGARLALVVMGFGSALFGALTGCAGLFGAGLIVPALFVIRGLMGLCSAPVYPACGRVVSRWIPYPQRAFANGMVTCAAPVGIALTFVGFGALMDRVDWQWAFAITGGITAVLALLWTLYATDWPAQHPSVNAAERRLIEQDEPAWSRKESPESEGTGCDTLRKRTGVSQPPGVNGADRPVVEQDKPALSSQVLQTAPQGGFWSLLQNRSLVLLTISYGAVNYFEYLFTFWMHHYLNDQLHMGTVESRYYAGILYLAEAAGMVLGGWLSDRLQRRYGFRYGRALVPVAGMIGSALFLGAGLFASQAAWVVLWFALAVGFVGMCEGPFWTTAIELGGSRGGTSAGLCNTGGNVGGLVAPVITPFMSGLLGWQWGIGLGSLVCLVGAALWWWIDPAERCTDEPVAS